MTRSEKESARAAATTRAQRRSGFATPFHLHFNRKMEVLQ